MPQNQRVVYTIMDFRILKLLPLRFWQTLIKLLQISRYHRMIRYMQVTFCNLVAEAKDSFQSKWKASCCGTSVAMACPIGWLCATSLMNAFFWASLGEKKRQRAQLGDLNAGSLLGSPPSEVFNCLLLITFQLQQKVNLKSKRRCLVQQHATTSRTPAFVRWEKIPRQVRPLGPSTHLDLTQNTSAARSRETKTKEDDGGIGTTARSCTVRIPPLRSLNRNLVFFKWEWDSETIAVVDTKDWNESLVATVLR